eukprot:jgi/Botrbrau1/1486/Bobra.178_3s0041.1
MSRNIPLNSVTVNGNCSLLTTTPPPPPLLAARKGETFWVFIPLRNKKMGGQHGFASAEGPFPPIREGGTSQMFMTLRRRRTTGQHREDVDNL